MYILYIYIISCKYYIILYLFYMSYSVYNILYIIYYVSYIMYYIYHILYIIYYVLYIIYSIYYLLYIIYYNTYIYIHMYIYIYIVCVCVSDVMIFQNMCCPILNIGNKKELVQNPHLHPILLSDEACGSYRVDSLPEVFKMRFQWRCFLWYPP